MVSSDGWVCTYAWLFRGVLMKRFRLGTLMFVIAIATLGFALSQQAKEMSRPGIGLEFRIAEYQRLLMILIATLCFASAKYEKKVSRRGISLDSDVQDGDKSS